MEVRVAQASAVIVQHVPAASKDLFMKWQRGIAEVAEAFPGYAGTDIYPPADASNDQWVIVQRFDDEEALEQWLTAPIRQQWIQKIQAAMGRARQMNLRDGFASWFNGGNTEGAKEPEGWKMILTVLLGLYPTVMLLTLYFPGPYVRGWGMAAAMLIGNALSVSILQWPVMPLLTTVLGPWLQSNRQRQPRLFYGVPVLMLIALVSLCVLFRNLSS